MKKLDLKKNYKEIYNPKKPSIVTIPVTNYITIEGEGNPNSQLFQKHIGALYAISYTISMSYKGDYKIENFENFVVSPLEGEWTTINDGDYDGNKDNLKWKIMIMQPEFITEEVFKWAREAAYEKKKDEFIKEVKYEISKERIRCVGMHIGSYDNEKETFDLMEEYVDTTEYRRSEFSHKEIYLSDFRKVSPEKLKTVLCFDVEKI